MRGTLLGLALVALIGIVDVMTGPEFGFAFFYFIPIVPTAWVIGRWPGIVIAVASAAMWFYADAVLAPGQSLAPELWNALSRLAIFLAGAYLIDLVKRDRTRMRRIDAQRDEFLRVLEYELPAPAQEMIQTLNEAQANGALDAAGIEALRHRAESLLFLTREFVALGQVQARRLELRRVPIDIAQLVGEIARERPDRASVLVTVPSEGLMIAGDPDRLRQALSDTVAQVIADAGKLDYVSMNVRSSGGSALVSISAAMPATTLRDDAPSPAISLQLARLLVEAMGGTLDVERPPLGRGTRVTVRLPLAPLPSALPAIERVTPRAR